MMGFQGFQDISGNEEPNLGWKVQLDQVGHHLCSAHLSNLLLEKRLINHERYNEDKTSKPPLIYCFIPNVPNQKKADVKMTTETGVLFC